jgi:hypothetical protein
MGQSFNPKVEALIDLMANPLEKRTKEALAEAVGYHPKHVYRLQRDPDFREAVQERMRSYLGVNLPRVYATLFKLATDQDDIKAAELLLKAAGELGTPGVNVTTNTNVLQKNAAPPDTAEEFVKRFWAERVVGCVEVDPEAAQRHLQRDRDKE